MYNWFTLWYSWNNIVNQLKKKKQALSFYVIFIILRYLYLSILVFAWDTNKTNTMIRNWQNESLYLMVWISCYLVHGKSLYLAWLPQSDFSRCGLFFLFLNFTILYWFCQISKINPPQVYMWTLAEEFMKAHSKWVERVLRRVWKLELQSDFYQLHTLGNVIKHT